MGREKSAEREVSGGQGRGLWRLDLDLERFGEEEQEVRIT